MYFANNSQTRNYLILTGFLIAISAWVIFAGQAVISTYENSVHSDLQSKLTNLKLVAIEQAKKAENTKIVNVVLVGDIMLSRAVGNKMQKTNDYKFPFLEIADVLKPADIIFGNLEGPISSRGKNQGSQYSFRADPKTAEGLVFAGFNILSLANNHIWDYGKDALVDTLSILKSNDISPIGAGLNSEEANSLTIKEVKGVKIGFLAFTNLYLKSFEAGKSYPGISSFDVNRVSKKISETKKSGTADFVIVSMHWGDEYQKEPSEGQIKIARQLVDAGADLIVGHHPHIVQKIESYKNAVIFYSLGNFIFDQNFSDETTSGYVIKVKIKDKKILNWEALETKINFDFQAEISQSSSGQK
jgi:poly-gamma-glutamate synthesis protein (capsule biosynthesis protein)